MRIKGRSHEPSSGMVECIQSCLRHADYSRLQRTLKKGSAACVVYGHNSNTCDSSKSSIERKQNSMMPLRGPPAPGMPSPNANGYNMNAPSFPPGAPGFPGFPGLPIMHNPISAAPPGTLNNVVPAVILPETGPLSVFVGKLPTDLHDSYVRNLLEKCGRVISWRRTTDPMTGKPKGFGYCVYAGARDVLRALRLLHGFSVDSKQILVNVDAKTREKLEEYEAAMTERMKKDEEAMDNDVKQVLEAYFQDRSGLYGGQQNDVSSWGDLLLAENGNQNQLQRKLSAAQVLVRQETEGNGDQVRGKMIMSEIEKFRLAQDQRERDLEAKRREAVREQLRREREEDERRQKALAEAAAKKEAEAEKKPIKQVKPKVSKQDKPAGKEIGSFFHVPPKPAPTPVEPIPIEQIVEEMKKLESQIEQNKAKQKQTERPSKERRDRHRGRERDRDRHRRRRGRSDSRSRDKSRRRRRSYSRSQSQSSQSSTSSHSQSRDRGRERKRRRHHRSDTNESEQDRTRQQHRAQKKDATKDSNESAQAQPSKVVLGLASAPKKDKSASSVQAPIFEVEEETAVKPVRELVPIDYSDEDKVSSRSKRRHTKPTEPDLRRLIQQIPTETKKLFAYPIDWTAVEKYSILENKMSSWISKKITEYLGQVESTMVEFILKKMQRRTSAETILEELQLVLEDDAQVFVKLLWRKLAFESIRADL